MELNSKIFVAGHRGLVGSAIVRTLSRKGFANIITRSRSELDLMNQLEVTRFFESEKPEYVFLAAAKVGGILSNSSYPADFVFQNLSIQSNIIDSAYRFATKKLLFLGSSCIYPKLSPQPIKEEYLLTGPLEETNAPYAVAKIAGITMCQSYNRQYGTNFISVMPTNLYGENDNFNLETSHVIPALLRKFDEAKSLGSKQVTLWGSGEPKREFLHVDDLADALLFLMENYNDSGIINIGTGEDLAISELAKLVKEITGFGGDIVWDREKPDGTPRKLLDVEKIHKLGWKHSIDLPEGLAKTYDWYKQDASRKNA